MCADDRQQRRFGNKSEHFHSARLEHSSRAQRHRVLTSPGESASKARTCIGAEE